MLLLFRVYIVLWMLLVLAVGAAVLTGNFTQLAATVFGFISMPLIFAGMIIILPGTLMHATDIDEVHDAPKSKLKHLSQRTQGDWSVTNMAARKFN